MSYFDINTITDVHVKDLLEIEDKEQLLLNLDAEIEAVAAKFGVLSEDIPVNESGYLKSATLTKYARQYLSYTLLSDNWGAAGGDISDIYKAKKDAYKANMEATLKDLTKENILCESTQVGSFLKVIPITRY